ncbi:MAG: heavy metal-responsive transcriptional regulator [Acidimicrobiia bacterium]|jgi:DNA-binding transcriptional MerR regulator|nr:heavy metal-responsive transcriptional regulator [Acidimicrobiia bacterium]
MKIGELSQRTGVSTKTIRFYEDQGVLPPADRAPNGYRDYPEDAVDRLRFVKDAQSTGLTLTEISAILDLRRQGDSTCEHVVDLLEGHLSGLERHIERLQRTKAQLVALTERARSLDPAECVDPNRCQTIAGDATGDRVSDGRGNPLHSTPHQHAHRG